MKNLVKLILAALLVGTAGLAGADEAQVDPAVKQRVRSLLSGYERVPKPEEILAVPNADRVLEALWNDGAVPGFVRARALSSLSVLPPENEIANRVLTKTLADEQAHVVFRRTAVRSYVTLRGEASLPVVQPLLAHPEFTLRQAAIEALAFEVPKSAKVRAALEARLPAEVSPVVKERLQAALAPMAATSGPAATPATK